LLTGLEAAELVPSLESYTLQPELCSGELDFGLLAFEVPGSDCRRSKYTLALVLALWLASLRLECFELELLDSKALSELKELDLVRPEEATDTLLMQEGLGPMESARHLPWLVVLVLGPPDKRRTRFWNCCAACRSEMDCCLTSKL
jgi:hypothetical protein